MTDKEIIQALECCGDDMLNWCTDCPYFDKENDFCKEDLHRDALDLINRQQKEIERLSVYNVEIVNRIKTSAIKEFAEKLKDNIGDAIRYNYEQAPDGFELANYCIEIIDNLVKEMVGAE